MNASGTPRFSEVRAGWADAKRTPKPSIKTARRIGTCGYAFGYALYMIAN